MTKRTTKLAALLATVTILLTMAFSFSSYTSRHAADDMWQLLGLSKQQGNEQIKSSFINGYLHYYGAKNIRKIAVNDRAAIAKDLLAYTKQFINSDEFKKQYETFRAQAKPEELELKPIRTKEQVQKEEIAKTEKSLKDMEKSMKELGPQMAKDLQPLADMLKKNLKDYQNPNHEYFAMMVEGDKYDRESQIRSHKERMEKWEKNYPASVKVFVADKLNKMIAATNGIDYDAKLVEKYGKKRFVNAAYEGKGTEWKQGFRAGKDVTEPARAFAKQWLAELK